MSRHRPRSISDDFLLRAIVEHATEKSQALISDGADAVTYAELADLIIEASMRGYVPVSVDPNSVAYVVDYVLRRTLDVADAYATELLGTGEPLLASLEGEKAEVLRTSGSSGARKYAIHATTSQEVVTNSINDYILCGANVAEVIAIPIAHSSGRGRLRAALRRGATIDLCRSPLRPKRLFEAFQPTSPSAAAISPATLRYARNLFGDRIFQMLSRFDCVEFGSAFLWPEEINELAERVHEPTRLLMHYGLTEAPRSALRDLRMSRHWNEIGCAMPHAEIVLDPSSHEVLVRGQHVAKWIAENDSLHSHQGDSYIRTGDVGALQEGSIVLVGRSELLVNVGGISVSIPQMEADLSRFLKASGFAICAIPDEILDQALVLVVPSDSKDDARAILRNAEFRSRYPSSVIPRNVVAVQAMPKLESGKIDRVSLAALLRSAHG